MHYPRIRPGAVLVFLVVLSIPLALGFWQLDRAAQKQTQRDRLDAALHEPPILLHGGEVDWGAFRYYPAEARGEYLRDRQFLLDNRVHQGRVGYEVLTPFRLAGSDVAVLVDRGWVPLGADRATLPDVAFATPVNGIRGRLDLPYAVGLRLGVASPGDSRWPRVVQYADVAELEPLAGVRLLPLVLLLDTNEPEGYLRDFRLEPVMGPEKHRGYAVQWFALAATFAVFALVLWLKRQRP